jgi:hypothetical protein
MVDSGNQRSVGINTVGSTLHRKVIQMCIYIYIYIYIYLAVIVLSKLIIKRYFSGSRRVFI